MNAEQLYARQRQEMVKALDRVEKAEAEVARLRRRMEHVAEAAEEAQASCEALTSQTAASRAVATVYKAVAEGLRIALEAPDAT